MLTPSALYRRLLLALALVFVASRLVVFFVLGADPLNGWLASILYSPFFAPALGGAFVMQAMGRRSGKEAALTTGIGAVLGLMHALSARWAGISGIHPLIHATFGLGVASLGVMGFMSWRTRGVDRETWLSLLLPAAVLPSFVAVSTFFLSMTVVLHPTVYDTSVFAADRLFGIQPSFVIGRMFHAASPLRDLCTLVYWALPLALAFVYSARRRQNEAGSEDILFSFIALGVVGFILYHLYPVAGPLYFFNNRFPNDPGDVVAAGAGHVLRIPVPRNCMPSLHTAWALLLFWHSRPLARYARVLAASWLALTVLATLGLGYHYAMDLVVALPFAMAIRAGFAARSPAVAAQRRRALLVGNGLTAAWMVGLRFFPPASAAGSLARWALAAATVGVSWILERSLDVKSRQVLAESSSSATAASVEPVRPSITRAEIGIAAIFFVSGLSGLIYEIVFAKSLALAFGSTATAATTVLATYMGGISLGAWIGGELGERRNDPLRVYALCEVTIAIYCAATPWLFTASRQVYVSMASGMDPGRPILVLLQALLGAAVLLPPTVLMGITMPVLAKQFVGVDGLGRSIGLLYGANTLGAAFGSWLTGYVVLPFLGVTGTTWLAVLANLCVGLAALRLSAKVTPKAGESTGVNAPAVSTAPDAPRSAGVLAVVVLGVGGVITLALETTDIHLLAVVAGNSAYAFSLMLFAFLVGLGMGASVARRLLRNGPARLLHLSVVELALAATILAGVGGWDQIPGYFASYGSYPSVRAFGSRELVRFVVCCVMMIPPAFFIGVLFPVAMDLVTRAARGSAVRAMGRASALNTVGNILGAIVGGFFLVPLVGSLHALQLLAGTAVALALLPVPWLVSGERRLVALMSLSVLALGAVQPRSFDYRELAGGGNVYFTPNPHGRVIAHAESLDGGLTTVHEVTSEDGKRVLTLLTNGKFQGDNAGQMKAQFGFALYPLLHTTARDRALVIGLGTGVSAATALGAGFREVDIAELSGDIVRITDEYFAPLTGAILHQPGVNLHITDGRNFLLLGKSRYDLVTIEVTSIWFAGAANLYNREFYQLVKARLTPEGILQQWIQLHRLGVEDIASILGTVRSEFRHVWLYYGGAQGIVVACASDCRPTREALHLIDEAPGVRESLSLIGGHASGLLADRMLTPESVDLFLARIAATGLSEDQLVSTDDNLFLEYSTPRGNVRDYQASLDANVALLRRFAPPSLSPGTQLTEEEIAASLTPDAGHAKESP